MSELLQTFIERQALRLSMGAAVVWSVVEFLIIYHGLRRGGDWEEGDE